MTDQPAIPGDPEGDRDGLADRAAMRQAIAAAEQARYHAPPNPWVGACVVTPDGRRAVGATEPPGQRHAERVALDAIGDATGATVFVTLEPCAHHGRTGPCADALIEAGVRRVLVGVEDPDPHVRGRGIARLRDAGVEVDVGLEAEAVDRQLRPYLHHRRTGRPYVVLKLAASLDGRTAAPDGSSQWITGVEARADAHRLRAESQTVIVGAGTVRTDDPALTVRHVDGPSPRRIVLGDIPPGSKVQPADSWIGSLDVLVDQLGQDGVLQALVEGGATVARAFHEARLVDRYVIYLAPALFGGDDALGMFRGPGAPTMDALVRGRIVSVSQVGEDLRVDMAIDPPAAEANTFEDTR